MAYYWLGYHPPSALARTWLKRYIRQSLLTLTLRFIILDKFVSIIASSSYLCLWWFYINDGRLVIEDFNLKRIKPFFYLLNIKEINVGNRFPAINSVYFIIIYIVLVHIWDGEDVHCYYLGRLCKHDHSPVDDSILGGTYTKQFVLSTYLLMAHIKPFFSTLIRDNVF